MTLWTKGKASAQKVMDFTVGKDPEFDKELAPYDIVGSMAHAIMLGEVGLITSEEAEKLVAELAAYYPAASDPSFVLNKDDEDIHSHLESLLVSRLGDIGKKIHTARSRNDQVLTAMALMMKEEWKMVLDKVAALCSTLLVQGEAFRDHLIPGYTHTQVAMPSSIALWLGSYAESLVSDLKMIEGVIRAIDQNPLGSAAGYGSSFPIDREKTTELLDFSELLVSSPSAQLSRGKSETLTAFGLSSLAQTISRFAADAIMFMGQDLGFISFPEELTTGSSIMPHKKNPDVLELIRAHCNNVIQTPGMLTGMTSNLISGYHRDLQLTKEYLFPAFRKLGACLEMTEMMVSAMKVKEDIMKLEKYRYAYSVEEVNSKVMDGLSFRDAYREVGQDIDAGTFNPGGGHSYTHVGSIGNPGLDTIAAKLDATLGSFRISGSEEIFEKLKGYYNV